MRRNFKKLKEPSDWQTLDAPVDLSSELVRLHNEGLNLPEDDQMILRMLVKPKYNQRFEIPPELHWLAPAIYHIAGHDQWSTGIENSWCYVTVRKGTPRRTTDEWHFDGGSLRTELIPERNYIWSDSFGCQYKEGSVEYPNDFNPLEHNMFTYAVGQVKDNPIKVVKPKTWYMLSPFVLHRRDPASNGIPRTFIRISMIDIEVRDENQTPNPLLPTEAYGRNPVKSFRNKLKNYPE